MLGRPAARRRFRVWCPDRAWRLCRAHRVACLAQPALEVLTPEQAAQLLSVSVEDVLASIQSGELKARRIGTAYRIARSALDEFLRG